MRSKKNFNADWYFLLGDDSGYASVECDESGWRKLQLPHDWSTEFEPDYDAPTGGGGGYATAGVGWYRKHFTVESIRKDEKISVMFEGSYMDSTVYLNGEKVGAHGYGYTSFQIDLTDKLKIGENVLAVKVDNSHQPNSRWYSGSGIYRPVWLISTNEVHFSPWGIRCDTNGLYLEQSEAALQIKALVTNESKESVYIGVIHDLYDKDGNSVFNSGTALYLEPGETSDCMVRPAVENPHLWSHEDPYLYQLVSTVLKDGEVVDKVSTAVGIRTATFDSDKGFILNGKSVKIKGMCLHHDCGMTGAVGYREAWERRLRILKDMGCNGIRCAHNPPEPAFLDLCDELGFLVMDEIFDEWMLTKNKINNYYSQAFAYGSSQFFANHAEEYLVNMLHRDYNHPSIILWSIGNEIPEQSSADGVKILNFLQDICHREDSCRMVTAACDNIVSATSARTTREFENALDVVGYNYVGRWRERAETFYEEDKLEFPERRMIGSENPSVGGIRGVYTMDGSAYWRYDYRTSTMRHEALWRYTASRDFVAGDYLWTGIDYLGETRWPSRGACCAPIDTAGFKKDAFYYFRSIWNDKDITLHLVPHWNWNGDEGEFKQIICYTNCDEVKLYINDKLVGTRAYMCPNYGCVKAWNDPPRVNATTSDLHLSWDVPYEAGVLRAEGYRQGELVAVEVVETTSEAVGFTAQADAETITKDGIVHIELSAYDKEGRFVPDAAPEITCKIEGPAHLVGMDGGNLNDLSLYSNATRKMFSGKLLAMLQGEGPGEVKVTFTAENMEPVVVVVNVE